MKKYIGSLFVWSGLFLASSLTYAEIVSGNLNSLLSGYLNPCSSLNGFPGKDNEHSETKNSPYLSVPANPGTKALLVEREQRWTYQAGQHPGGSSPVTVKEPALYSRSGILPDYISILATAAYVAAKNEQSLPQPSELSTSLELVGHTKRDLDYVGDLWSVTFRNALGQVLSTRVVNISWDNRFNERKVFVFEEGKVNLGADTQQVGSGDLEMVSKDVVDPTHGTPLHLNIPKLMARSQDSSLSHSPRAAYSIFLETAMHVLKIDTKQPATVKWLASAGNQDSYLITAKKEDGGDVQVQIVIEDTGIFSSEFKLVRFTLITPKP